MNHEHIEHNYTKPYRPSIKDFLLSPEDIKLESMSECDMISSDDDIFSDGNSNESYERSSSSCDDSNIYGDVDRAFNGIIEDEPVFYESDGTFDETVKSIDTPNSSVGKEKSKLPKTNCPNCNKVITLKTLDRHMKEIHSTHLLYTCDPCDFSTERFAINFIMEFRSRLVKCLLNNLFGTAISSIFFQISANVRPQKALARTANKNGSHTEKRRSSKAHCISYQVNTSTNRI